MIYLMAVFLGVMLFGQYYLSNKELVSPSFLFIFGFLICSIIASSNADKLQLGLHINTFFVIITGVSLFGVASLYFEHMEPLQSDRLVSYSCRKMPYIDIRRDKIFIFLFFEIITILLSLSFVRKLSGGIYFSEMLYVYRTMSMSVDTAQQTVFPSYLSFFRLVVDAGSYLFAYIFANNSLIKKKIQFLPFGVFIIALLCNGLTGGRGSIVNQIVALVVNYIFLKSYYEKKITINIKNFFIGLFAIFLGLLGFEKIGTLMGRSSQITGLNYLVGYCGAELKNLDIFLQSERYRSNTIFGSQTFVNLINWIGGKINPSRYIYTLDNPFHVVDGFGIGNVSTTFYAFIYDFGYWGVVPLTLFMGFVSGKLFLKSKQFMNNNQQNSTSCNLALVFYGYIASTVLTSFFSNKFYETIFSGVFFKSFFVILFLYAFFCKINFAFGGHRVRCNV